MESVCKWSSSVSDSHNQRHLNTSWWWMLELANYFKVFDAAEESVTAWWARHASRKYRCCWTWRVALALHWARRKLASKHWHRQQRCKCRLLSKRREQAPFSSTFKVYSVGRQLSETFHCITQDNIEPWNTFWIATSVSLLASNITVFTTLENYRTFANPHFRVLSANFILRH